jgi:hypothetical protein
MGVDSKPARLERCHALGSQHDHCGSPINYGIWSSVTQLRHIEDIARRSPTTGIHAKVEPDVGLKKSLSLNSMVKHE